MIWSKIPTKTEQKLVSFTQLETGWHYGRGAPISELMLSRAFAAYLELMLVGFSQTDAFPCPDGDVLVTGYRRDHYVGVTVHQDATFSFVHEVGDKECCELDNCSLSELKRALLKVSEEIWGSSDSSIQNYGRGIAVDGATRPLKSPQTETGYLSSLKSVRSLQAA